MIVRLANTLTAFPHFIAAWIALSNGYAVYAAIITAATLASVLMHMTDACVCLDYALAVLWSLVDAWQLRESIVWNALVFHLHFEMKTHWQWHLVSATKAVYIAWMICLPPLTGRP